MTDDHTDRHDRNGDQDDVDELDRILHLYCEEGWSIDELADRFGFSRTTAYRKLYGWRNEKQPWRGKAALRVLYDRKELTAAEIADELECSEHTVYNWLEKHGIEREWGGAYPGERAPAWKGGRDGYYGPSWKRQRRRARARDDYSCQICGLDDDSHKEKYGQELHVHHIEPFRSFDDPESAHQLDNLVTLCRQCHDRAECGDFEHCPSQ